MGQLCHFLLRHHFLISIKFRTYTSQNTDLRLTNLCKNKTKMLQFQSTREKYALILLNTVVSKIQCFNVQN